ncbi:leucine-zipper-like transcriptional regulator 1 isoform X2 [Pleurodeles waltl]
MKEESRDWLWEPIPQRAQAPCDRFKHACAMYGGFIYIFGGRNNTILSDFWRYRIEYNEWEPLVCCEKSPEKLEGHSMVAYQAVLYVFGGMLDSGFTQGKTPLWLYNIDSEGWTQSHTKDTERELTGPVNRKSHSAVVFEAGMYIYGGYLDLKGASEEFWFLNFDSMKWTRLPPGSCDCGPGPRYGHSSVVYKDAMYVFGGLVGMVEKNDFWTWNFYSQMWTIIKSSFRPPKVMGHSSVVFEDCMLVFGGGRPNDSATSHLWKFQFCSQSWKKISFKDVLPISQMYHSLLGVGLSFQQKIKFSNQSKDDFNQMLKEGQQSRAPYNTFQTLRYNKVSNITNGIEMKIFTQCPGVPLSTSKQTFSKYCAIEGQAVLSEVETSFFNPMFGCPEDNEDMTRYPIKDGDVTIQHRDYSDVPLKHFPDVLLLIGGKPLAGCSSISIWQMKME